MSRQKVLNFVTTQEAMKNSMDFNVFSSHALGVKSRKTSPLQECYFSLFAVRYNLCHPIRWNGRLSKRRICSCFVCGSISKYDQFIGLFIGMNCCFPCVFPAQNAWPRKRKDDASIVFLTAPSHATHAVRPSALLSH